MLKFVKIIGKRVTFGRMRMHFKLIVAFPKGILIYYAVSQTFPVNLVNPLFPKFLVQVLFVFMKSFQSVQPLSVYASRELAVPLFHVCTPHDSAYYGFLITFHNNTNQYSNKDKAGSNAACKRGTLLSQEHREIQTNPIKQH